MTKLACRYGVDPEHPEKGVVIAFADDAERIDMTSHPDCLYLEVAEPVETWGRFGPEPSVLGDAPDTHFKSNVELDELGIPEDHPWRKLAGRPVKDDNRLRADDYRPWTAPDLTPDIARVSKRVEMASAFAAADVGGFTSKATGTDRRYPSDADALSKLQIAAFAALAGQSKPGWTATLRCTEGDGEAVGVPHTAKQVHAVLADYQAFADALHAERDAVEVQIVSAADVDAVLAISRA